MLPAGDLVRKPGHIDHAVAAGLPMAGLTAYQFLVHRFLAVVRDGGTINPVFFGAYHRDRAAGRGITVAGGQVHAAREQLEVLVGLLADGRLRVALDGVYPLAEAAAAHARAEQGHLQGKLVLTATG